LEGFKKKWTLKSEVQFGLVREEGLEPSRVASLDSKSSASTNSATPVKEKRRFIIGEKNKNSRGRIRSRKEFLKEGSIFLKEEEELQFLAN
jgi:hypothetical protein